MHRSSTSLSKVFVLFFAFFLVACTPENPIPNLTGRVVDNAKVLSSDEQKELTRYLQRIDNESKVEIVVLTINDLPENYDLENYANKIFNTWGIGKKETDSGLLFILVKNARKIRIEVGRGNEGAMPDIIANDIIREHMAPKFREGKFYEGFREAARVSSSRLRNEHK